MTKPPVGYERTFLGSVKIREGPLTAQIDNRPEPVLDGVGGQRQGEVVADTAVHQLVLAGEVAGVVGRAARVALNTDGRVRIKYLSI